jgi:enterobactin synthetase component D
MISSFGTIAMLDVTDADLDSALASLHPDERALAATLGPARQRDWIAGRAALRRLLDDAGVAPTPILVDDRGAPILPAGWVGSISHKRGVAAAIVTSSTNGWVGIDVERAAPPRLDISRRVLTDAELERLAALPEDQRGLRITLSFAIKEAIYKAIDPTLRRYVGFREVELLIDSNAVTVSTAIPLAIEAEWREQNGMWLCTARARHPYDVRP